MFVGDGLNDAPVLSQADIGVVINSNQDLTVNSADIILMKDSLFDVINAIKISKQTFNKIKLNFIWAFMYNMLLVPVAMGVFYPFTKL